MQFADTSVWIDQLAGRSTPQTRALSAQLRAGPVPLGDLVAMEVLRGLRHSGFHRRVRRDFASMPMFAMADTATVLQAGDYYRDLRSRGVTVRSPIDCIIATFCIRGGHTLLHSDHDFDHFERHFGLRPPRAGTM